MQTRALIFVCGLVSASCLALPTGGFEPGAASAPNTAVPYELRDAELDTVTVSSFALFPRGDVAALAVLSAINEIDDISDKIVKVIPPRPQPPPETGGIDQGIMIIPFRGTRNTEVLDRAHNSVALLATLALLGSNTQLTERFRDEIGELNHVLREVDLNKRESKFAKQVGPTFLATVSVLEDHPHLAERLADQVGNLREFLRETGLSNKEAKQLATTLSNVENRFHIGATALKQHPRLEKRLTKRLRNLARTRTQKP